MGPVVNAHPNLGTKVRLGAQLYGIGQKLLQLL